MPSDTAVLDTEVRHAGGDPGKVHVVTIGFDGAQALAAGRIAAFTGFIPDDGVQLQVSGHPITAFALDRNGGPAYPGLVAFTTRAADRLGPWARAGLRGGDRARATRTRWRTRARSLGELLRANPTLQPAFTRASLQCLPAAVRRPHRRRIRWGLGPGPGAAPVPFGTLQPRNVAAMSSWMLANHLIDAPIAPERYGTNRFVAGA